MAGDPFAQATARLLARLGVEAVLHDTVPTRALMQYGIDVIGDAGQLAAKVTTATLSTADLARLGDTLVVDGVSYFLDTLHAFDGYSQTYILSKSA
jgi:hypothetical protein